jgi:hypothetical protein
MRKGLKPSWHKYSWLAEVIAQILNYRNNRVVTVRLWIFAARWSKLASALAFRTQSPCSESPKISGPFTQLAERVNPKKSWPLGFRLESSCNALACHSIFHFRIHDVQQRLPGR